MGACETSLVCDKCHKSAAVRHLLEQSALEPHPEVELAEAAFLGAAQMSTAHILAVDDDPSVRQMIVDYLSENDLQVTALASGRQIAELMKRDTIDLVVLDLRLPGEDGMEIARQLREESVGLPIIMLTGRKDEADRVMG